MFAKMWKLLAFGFAAGLFFMPCAANADLGNAEKVFSEGDWTVLREKDAMTDKPSCVGIYKGRFDIQLSESDLYIVMKGRGGVKSYTLRFNEESPLDMQLASNKESDLNMVDIHDTAFERTLKSTRLRAEIFTVLESIEIEDINLNGISKAHDFIVGTQCK